jgi:uncharacterized protein (TIGR00251 family)
VPSRLTNAGNPIAAFATVDVEGVTLSVRVTPRAAKSALNGVVALPNGRSALAVRIAAPPVEGAANAALAAFLAAQLGLRKGDVTIVSGEGARIKIVRITGDGGAIAERLRSMAFGA